MLGQAVIKGVLFFAYGIVSDWVASTFGATFHLLPNLQLLVCAGISGALASLFVTPIERVKVIMQASDAGEVTSTFSLLSELIRADGLSGLLLRGLGATLGREIPGYMLYFWAYETVKGVLLANAAVPSLVAPLIGGAAAGMAAWVPVYPIDVVKTNLQASTGAGLDESFIGCASRLRAEQGWGVFWEGLTPKLLRAVVNHATTFFVFENLCDYYTMVM